MMRLMTPMTRFSGESIVGSDAIAGRIIRNGWDGLCPAVSQADLDGRQHVWADFEQLRRHLDFDDLLFLLARVDTDRHGAAG
jgi:hypothetical protein